METSIFIAKILGLVYLVFGLGMLISGDYYRKSFEKIIKDPFSPLYLGGVVDLVVGFLIITYHNIWVSNWVVLVTIVGWLALLKGFSLLVFPKSMMKFSASFIKKKNWLPYSLFVLVLGLIFGYYGFLA